MMIYSEKMQRAVRFMLKTHEVYQKQKRKGKDIPYLSHPLVVGMILSRAGASEDLVVAGILHDTIEDSVEEKKVTFNMIEERFGSAVADLVNSVTEQDRGLSWDERKQDALAHIDSFNNDSILLKSADVIANNAEVLEDYAVDGEEIFARFNAPKEKIVGHAQQVILALQAKWPESPLCADLGHVSGLLAKLIS